ncbi:hypothetical protein S58_08710 [Bradyrhizobium oligotrophicum S58]|uniref:Uncharacterized protein n=1 Tax=Bradyrhizobium oligotrophicum S58 TaxID=1245469 RepID=M4Z291_9BRAD|nr:hypothetical protein S58_08710 [Bradyrhizobium oligotrophicum S58]
MDRLGACLTNDIDEPRLAGIDGLGTKIAIGIRDAPAPFASQELEEVTVRPAKRRLKRQMQPIEAQGDRDDETTHCLRPDRLEGHLDPDGGRVQAHAASLGSWAPIV